MNPSVHTLPVLGKTVRLPSIYTPKFMIAKAGWLITLLSWRHDVGGDSPYLAMRCNMILCISWIER